MRFDNLYCKFSLRPIEPKYFIGRGAQIGHILDIALSRNHLGLIHLQGPSKIGRTSLLNFMKDLARKKGEGTTYQSQFLGTDPLCCLFIDLRTLAMNTVDDFRTAFTRSIAKELLDYEFELSEVADHGTSLDFVRVFHAMMIEQKVRYFLFIDRAELLLDKKIQDVAAELLGILNDNIEQFGILLSFGASGLLSSQDVFERTRETEACIASISSLMNLIRENVTLDLLNPSDAEAFLRREWYNKNGERVKGPLEEDMVQWMLDLSGGHPYLLNMVGVLVCETLNEKSFTSDYRSEIEDRLISQLQSFVENTLRRLPTDALDIAMELASDSRNISPKDLEERILVALEGESIIDQQGDKISIPSRLMRKLIRDHASAGKSIAPVNNRPLTIQKKLIVKEGRSTRPIPLTGTESEIMVILLSSPNKVISQQKLYSSIWKQKPGKDNPQWQQRLIQRVSKLRKKIVDATGLDPIENIYGEGYKITDASKYSIS